MADNDMIVRLIHYRDLLEAGQELSEEERADLDAILEVMMEAIKVFAAVLQDAMSQIAAILVPALRELWEAFPDSLKSDIEEPKPALPMVHIDYLLDNAPAIPTMPDLTPNLNQVIRQENIEG